MLGLILAIALWVATVALAFWWGRRTRPVVAVAAPTNESVRVEIPVGQTPSSEVDPEFDPGWNDAQAIVEFQRLFQNEQTLAVIRELRSTTDPLTENLLSIRTETARLIDRVRSYDQAVEAGNDMTWVDKLGIQVHRDMAEVAQLIQDSNRAFENHFLGLRAGLEKILDVIRQIEDLSERINVLSINASIEAARAGVAGRGFKVIASEVKSMAHETSGLLGQISQTIHQTQSLFQGVGKDLEDKRSGVGELLGRQEKSFDSFRVLYQEQGGRLEELHRDVSKFVVFLDRRIVLVSPVIQLHDIVVQELENLALVRDDGFEDLAALVRNYGDPNPNADTRKEILQHQAVRARTHLTTAPELQSLASVKDRLALGHDADEAVPAAGAIELFS